MAAVDRELRMRRPGPPRPVILLPGTLMGEAALQPLATALDWPARIELLGVEDDFDAEIERLAGLGTQPAVWIGHSLGGIAALHLAVRHPERCAALAVLASNARPDGPHGVHNRSQQLAALDRGGMAALLDLHLAPVYDIGDDRPLRDALLTQAVDIGVDRFRRQLRYAAQRPGLLHPPSLLPMPVLALSGSADPLCPPGCGEEAVARSTHMHSRHRVLDGAGHLLPVQEPSWCARQIRRFLARLA